jgi:hypothetical protein
MKYSLILSQVEDHAVFVAERACNPLSSIQFSRNNRYQNMLSDEKEASIKISTELAVLLPEGSY